MNGHDKHLIEVIFSKCQPEPNSGCWLWLGPVDSDGYGVLNRDSIRTGAHRGSYRAHFGPIARGLLVCHRCDNRSCVNPNHLFLGTIQDNNRDCRSKGRTARWGGRRGGEGNPNARLTGDDVRRIREAHASGKASYRVLAKAHGLNLNYLKGVVKGRYWKEPCA